MNIKELSTAELQSIICMIENQTAPRAKHYLNDLRLKVNWELVKRANKIRNST